MKVILLESIRGVGRVGDIKDVNDGYARNFLFPRGAAKPATNGSAKEIAALQAKKEELTELAQSQVRELAKELSQTKIELAGKANAKGTLFAAISEVTINGRTFALPEPIKTTGEHPVVLELADGVTATVLIAVTPAR